jgi:hypothetical protein
MSKSENSFLSAARFGRLERLMSDLLAKMRRDLLQHPLRREFAVSSAPEQYQLTDDLEYYGTDFKDLKDQIRILQNCGLIEPIGPDRASRFVMQEEFVDYLVYGPAAPTPGFGIFSILQMPPHDTPSGLQGHHAAVVPEQRPNAVDDLAAPAYRGSGSAGRRQRGRPTKFTDENKRRALEIKSTDGTYRDAAKILYGTLYPTPQQVKNARNILKNYQQKLARQTP